MSDIVDYLREGVLKLREGRSCTRVELIYSFNQAAELIEQQQQRIAELEETLKNLGDATLSSLVKQFDEAPEGTEFDRTHPILQLAISHFAVAQRNDELAATVERLREAILDYQNKNHDLNILLVAATKTPRQNLNAIKREAAATAIRVALRKLGNADLNESEINHFADDYINQRYPSVKRGES